ncbi:MAG: G5 domain-containing protein [Peptoniphilus harei]|uniref:G5 domain-containing protein n=1 Tax=Peptoniphilus harei TaxID=54005 RepID=UPI00290BDDE8|nr:G5 domain-containing protein [Peptoniphilus harei]MDU5471203.1 G5 domain-containing protein [Peptoniphilus harei]MDU6097903.1 G5 domain-containing protein [Peptoniphilus harei]
MKKKFLSLFLALIMILGVIPISIFAETGTQKYTITFIASKDVGNRDYGIEDIDGKESVSVEGGQYYRFKNQDYELSYYIDGKEVDGINPTKNTSVYVGVSGWVKNYYPVKEFAKKPEGYVVATFNSGEHGKFVGYKGSGSVSERKFYVPKFKEVDLSHAVYFVDIDKGWVDKGYDKPSKEGSFNKNLKGTFTSDTSFNAQYKEKNFTHKFIKINNKEIPKTLPAQSLYGDLKITAAKAKSSSPGDGSKFIGWQEYSIVNGKKEKGRLLDFNQSSNWVIDGPKIFREIWSKDHQVKFYQEYGDWPDLELVKNEEKIKSRSKSIYNKYYEITNLGYFDNSNGRWIPPTYNKSKEFDLDTPIKRDYNIVEVYSFSRRNKDLTLFVSTFPKKNYDTSKEGEKTVDLTGLVVGVKEGDKIKYIPYENLKAQGITTEPKQGDSVATLDGKSIKVTLGDNFAYSRETFKVKDDGFKKNSIASINIASQPKLDYKYDGDDEKAKTLDLSALSVELTDTEGKTRAVEFENFDYYGLTTNPANGKVLTAEDNGKPVKVSLKSKDSIFAETENLKVTTSKFDPEKVTSIAFAKDTKTNYLVGQKLDLANLKAVLTDENGNTKEVPYSDFTNNKITPTFEGDALDKDLTKEDNGKKLLLTLDGNNTPAELKISVVEFDSSKVKSITVKRQPKLDYSSGDKLDLSGLVVVLKDENEATKEVPFKDFANNKLTTSMKNGTPIENQKDKIKITFDGKISTETEPLKVTYIKPEERISTKEETVTETIPFKVIKKSDDTLPLGEEKTEQEGVNGSAEVKYKVTYKGTTETAREELSREVKTAAKDKVIKVGTKLAEAEEKFITVEEDIPFKIQVINDDNFEGENPEVSGGFLGKKKVTYKNDNGQKGKKVNEEIISPAQDLVIKKKPTQALPDSLPKEFTLTTTETIPFETEITKDATKDVGTKEVTQNGVDGKKVTIQKYKLEGNQYIPDGQPKVDVTPAQNEKITIGTKEVTVDVEEKDVTEKVKIPFETERKNNPSLEKGQERLIQEGKDGEKEITYTVKTRGGEVLSKTKKSEKVTKEATPKIIEVGTKESESPAPSPNPGYDWIYPNYRPRYYWDYKNLSTGVTTNNNIKNKVTKTISESIQYVLKIDSKIYERIVNGQSTRLTLDVAPIIQNSRTMLPMRFVAESIGAKVEWDKATRTASFTKNGIVAKIQIDENKIILSNGETIVMDSKPLNINNRILLPITNISRVFNMTNGNTTDGIAQDIEWNAVERTVTINVK